MSLLLDVSTVRLYWYSSRMIEGSETKSEKPSSRMIEGSETKSEKSLVIPLVIPVDAIEQLAKEAKSCSILTGDENFNRGRLADSKVGIDCGSIPIVNAATKSSVTNVIPVSFIEMNVSSVISSNIYIIRVDMLEYLRVN